MALLTIEHLSASYEEEQVLRDVNLTLAQGEIVCILGQSGAGKTSLLKAITGHKNLQILNGSILFDGMELTKMTAAKKRELMGVQIGMIPQNPAASFNPLRSFYSQIKELYKSHGKTYDNAEAIHALSSIGLKDPERVLRSRPYEMSGGMNQRIAIAVAMLLAPSLLICDEPTSALDRGNAALVVEEILELAGNHQTAVLMITHDPRIAERIADRTAIMEEGTLKWNC
ncbi:MAG: ABC transporter ATP-binding protein [Lachnospiraceae bacterium]|nr:ABC transporter ATP-binding protein [Lachnospiraceae bacterium]